MIDSTDSAGLIHTRSSIAAAEVVVERDVYSQAEGPAGEPCSDSREHNCVATFGYADVLADLSSVARPAVAPRPEDPGVEVPGGGGELRSAWPKSALPLTVGHPPRRLRQRIRLTTWHSLTLSSVTFRTRGT